MERFLSGKIAVVTGGTRGIGRAIVAALAAAGARVVLCGRSPEAVATAVKELKAETSGEIEGTATDVRNRDEVRELFEFTERTFGVPDILINNAGVGVFSPVADLSLEDWRRVIDINLTGVFHCSQEALVRFKRRGGGFIVNVSSLAGKNPFAGGAAYNASKFGLNGFTEAMMLDHRQDNVRVSLIMPGSVDTDFTPMTGTARAGWKIAPEDIGEIVLDILRMPERTLISRVEVRPSRPPK
jgi:NAD(P)-dependent dehydrogenase (short-subunit alcohol dehydrogenase family)